MKLSKKQREELARKASNPSELAKAVPSLCRADSAMSVLAVRKVGGGVLTADERKDLLARAVAKEEVSLEVDVLAYEQKTGEQNRNFVRFRDGAMTALGRTGKGKPFLQNHDQHDVQSRAGTILSSATEKTVGAEGHAIRQTVKLTAPWAVELALRELLDFVSIGWNPTGPVLCSACDAPIYTQCWHWPGDTLSEETSASGKTKKLKRDPKGSIVVEWIFTEAELVETSFVNVPGVPSARVEDVRAALSAAFPGLRSELDHEGSNNEEESIMDKELLKLLGLSEDANEAAVKAAILALKDKEKADGLEIEIHKKTLERVAKLESDAKKRDEDVFVANALSSGRIGKGDEEQWRALYAADSKRATELMAKRPENVQTPVGEKRQSAADPKDAGVELAPVLGEVRELRLEGGEIPGYTLYERGGRSKAERKEIARQLAAAVKALETHPNPDAAWWAARMGFEGRINAPKTLGATSIANSSDLDAARTAFRAVFMQQLEMAAVSPMEMLFQTVPTNTPLARIHWMGDLPGFEEWIGDRKLSGVEAFKLDLQSKKWANGLRIKNDDVKFDNLGLMPSQIGGLATKARRHKLDRMAGFMIDGFAGGTTSNGLAYDGAFFFADAHKGGNDNKLAVALDAAGLTAADLLLESMTTYDGNDALDTHGTHLIVGPKLRATAEKLLTQERLANGEDNYHRGKYKLIVDNRFRGAADDYWFLGDLSHEIKPFIYQLVEDITTSAVMGQESGNSMPSFMNDELLFGAQANYNMAYFEFRLLVGSVVA